MWLQKGKQVKPKRAKLRNEKRLKRSCTTKKSNLKGNLSKRNI